LLFTFFSLSIFYHEKKDLSRASLIFFSKNKKGCITYHQGRYYLPLGGGLQTIYYFLSPISSRFFAVLFFNISNIFNGKPPQPEWGLAKILKGRGADGRQQLSFIGKILSHIVHKSYCQSES